jgi:hypothetical protein
VQKASERGAWVGRVGERGREEAARVLLDELLGAEAQLFGRRTFEFLAARWPSRSGKLADRLNDMPKYVVSSIEGSRLEQLDGACGDVMEEVSKLKEELDGEIVVAGSIRLVSRSCSGPASASSARSATNGRCPPGLRLARHSGA